MVCYTEPSGKAPLVTVEEGKHFQQIPDRLLDEASHRLTSTN